MATIYYWRGAVGDADQAGRQGGVALDARGNLVQVHAWIPQEVSKLKQDLRAGQKRIRNPQHVLRCYGGNVHC